MATWWDHQWTGLFASFMLKSAFALVGFAAYMEVITTHYGVDDVNSKGIAMILLAFILVVNLTGVKAIKKVQVPIVTVAVATVVLLCIMALFSSDLICRGRSKTSSPSASAWGRPLRWCLWPFLAPSRSVPSAAKSWSQKQRFRVA